MSPWAIRRSQGLSPTVLVTPKFRRRKITSHDGRWRELLGSDVGFDRGFRTELSFLAKKISAYWIAKRASAKVLSFAGNSARHLA